MSTKQYYSQWRQDQVLNEAYFHDKKDGVFVDVGASDGVKMSNSYYYEKELGWTGLCIEPIPECFYKLTKARTATCINGCAYNESKIIEFTRIRGYSEMLSGIENCYHDRHRQRIQDEIRSRGGEKSTIYVQAYRLEDLFDKYNIDHVDYLSIDTEGSELQVLEGINFDKVKIHVIDIEENYPDAAKPVHELLKKHGFRFERKVQGDAIFVNPEYEN